MPQGGESPHLLLLRRTSNHLVIEMPGAFWSIWRLFYPRILTLAKRDKRWHESSEIIGNYLLAWSYWKEEAREWHSLRDRERQFFKQAAAEMGGRPSVFYSIVKTS
jgi:hypothetical protein